MAEKHMSWVTVKGNHIPVPSGTSKKEAVGKAISGKSLSVTGEPKKYGLQKKDEIKTNYKKKGK